MRKISLSLLKKNVSKYVLSNRVGSSYQFLMSENGCPTFYSSCFAAMTLHYCNALKKFSNEEKETWANYLNSYQDPDSGYFLAPEIVKGELSSSAHDQEHLLLHLVCHVLPALDLLGAEPRYELVFINKFTDTKFLHEWLEKRDWSVAWLEGNNLLFIGQILLYQYKKTEDYKYKKALDYWFSWLNKEVDPNSGLWGTNGYCDKYTAMYGGYHQLLLYFFQEIDINNPNALVDTVLSTQHFDGGFSKYQGGGTCQDVDAVDILVNMYKRNDYKRREIRKSLRMAVNSVFSRWVNEGGFEDKVGHEFNHMGMEETRTRSGIANMFSTWFTVHTLFLAAEIIGHDFLEYKTEKKAHHWGFNTICSMGWHDANVNPKISYGRLELLLDSFVLKRNDFIKFIYNKINRSKNRTL